MERRTFVKLLASTPLVAPDDAPDWKKRVIPKHKAVTTYKAAATPGMPGPYPGQVVAVKSDKCLSADGQQIQARALDLNCSSQVVIICIEYLPPY